MNRTSVLGVALLFSAGFVACNAPADQTQTDTPVASVAGYESFGQQIDNADIMDFASVENLVVPGEDFNAKIEGEIVGVCKKKGCWMTVRKPDGNLMRVTFKDYGFFVPTDAEGRHVVMEGIAYFDTLSVAAVRHYAKDAGKSEAEIEAITEPEVGLAFEATGVLIK